VRVNSQYQAAPTLQKKAAAQRPTQSFAALLAEGSSVKAMTSERALGFSETGMFGIHRFQIDKKGAVTPPLPSLVDQLTNFVACRKIAPVTLASTDEAGLMLSAADIRPSQPAQSSSDPILVDQVDRVVGNEDRSSANDPARQNPKFAVGDGEELYDVRTRLLGGNCQLVPRSNGRNRSQLSLNLDIDEGANMSIYVTSSSTSLGDQVYREFIDVSRQFGVTLNSVALNGWTAYVPYSNR
jgi:hypothetical protein